MTRFSETRIIKILNEHEAGRETTYKVQNPYAGNHLSGSNGA